MHFSRIRMCLATSRVSYIFIFVFNSDCWCDEVTKGKPEKQRIYFSFIKTFHVHTTTTKHSMCLLDVCVFLFVFSSTTLYGDSIWFEHAHTYALIQSAYRDISFVSVHSFVARTTRIIFRYALSHIRLCRQKYRCRCSQTKPPVNVFVRSMPLCECLCFEEFDIYWWLVR